MKATGARLAIVLAGFLTGGFIGFLFRPAVPFVGKLSFGTVLTRGGNLKGFDTLLIPTAEESFNYMAAGALLGMLVGLGVWWLTRQGLTVRDTSD